MSEADVHAPLLAREPPEKVATAEAQHAKDKASSAHCAGGKHVKKVSTKSMSESFWRNQPQQLFVVLHKKLKHGLIVIVVDREPIRGQFRFANGRRCIYQEIPGAALNNNTAPP